MNRAKPTAAASVPAAFALFTGDDILSRETARERLLTAVHDKHGPPTISSFDPSAEPIAAFLSRFITVSLFPEARVFQVRHADLLNDDETGELVAYLDHDMPDAFLIVESESAGGAAAGKGARIAQLVKAFNKRAKAQPDRYVVENFAKPRDYEVPAWIAQNAPRLLNRTISPKNAEFLVDLVGTDLGTIHSELQKIDLHLEPGAPIERKDIDHICGASREMAPFELAQALGKRDLPRALEIIDGLFASGFYGPLVVSAVFKHFWALWRIRAFAKQCPEDMQRFLNAVKHFDRQTQNAVGARIGVAAGIFTQEQAGRVYPVLIKQDLVGQARSFKDDHLMRIFGWLHEFDIDSKTGKCQADKSSVQLLCHKIARVAEV